MGFWKDYWWVILIVTVILMLFLFFLLRWFKVYHISYNSEKKRHFPQWSDVGIITRDNYLLHTNYNFVEDSNSIVIGIHSLRCAKEDFISAKDFFAEQKISLLGFDQRNWGKNSKWKYHSLGTTIADLEDIVSVLNEKFPNQKIFLLGEALGSAFCALALKRLEDKIDGVILTNFITSKRVIKMTPNLICRKIIGFLFNKQLILPIEFDLKKISDNEIYIDYFNERNYRRSKQQGVTVVYGLQGDKISKAVPKNINQSTCPAMIIQTGNDIFADYDKVKVNEKNWRDTVTYRFYDQGKHAILNDLPIQTILQDISAWIVKIEQDTENKKLTEKNLNMEQTKTITELNKKNKVDETEFE